MRYLIIAALLLVASIVSATECPPPVPAVKRVRIVECTDGTLAVQVLTGLPNNWETYEQCGLSLGDALLLKASIISSYLASEKLRCRPIPVPKQPIVEVK